MSERMNEQKNDSKMGKSGREKIIEKYKRKKEWKTEKDNPK